MQKLYQLLLVFLLFLLVFVGYFHRITAFTQDMGRHLLLGKIIFTTQTVPATNLLSYTHPSFPFLNHHYLSEVIFYLIFHASGALGLLLMATTLMLFSFGLLFRFAYKRSGLSACLAGLLLLPVLFERTDIRPEIFSFFFFSIFLVILYKNREKPTRLLYLLPLLIILWINMHIYFFMGILLILLFVIDAILTHRRNIWCTYTKTLVATLLLSAGASLLNPQFLQGALYPLSAFNNYGYSIEENQTIFFLESLGIHKTSVGYFKIAVFVLFLTLSLRFKKTRPIDWLLSIVFAAAGALAVRNLPLFALAVFIPFATNLALLLTSLSSKLMGLQKDKRTLLTHLFFLTVIACSIWQLHTVSQKNPIGFSIDPGATKAVDFLEKQQIKGPLFNNFDIGSYLAYRLYPRELVFVDGRPEAYPSDFFQKIYIPMQENESIFAKQEKHYRFNAIFFSHTDQTPWGETFLLTILKNPSWKPVYLDQTVIILVKNTPENTALIKRFGMNSTRLKADYNPNDKQSLLQIASFFSKIGDTENLFPLLQQLLSLDPENCQALYNRARIALMKQDPLSLSYATSYERICNKQLLQ